MPFKPPHNSTTKLKAVRATACKRGLDRKHRNMRERELQQQPLCVLCLNKGLVVEATEIDHIIPLSKGGDAHDPDNRQPVCRDCNQEKRDKMPVNSD